MQSDTVFFYHILSSCGAIFNVSLAK